MNKEIVSLDDFLNSIKIIPERPKVICYTHYTVVVHDVFRDKLINCICPARKCSDLREALVYYFKMLHEREYKVLSIEYSGYTDEELHNLTLAA